MDTPSDWDKWLAELDSAEVLAPEGYDDDAANLRAERLGRWLAGALTDYEVWRGSTELYQDGTGLVGHRVTAKGDRHPMSSALAWVVLSHFGNLATVTECSDLDLLARICRVLRDAGFNYIPCDYVTSKIYDGKCRPLVGLTWKNRYFALVADLNVDTHD